MPHLAGSAGEGSGKLARHLDTLQPVARRALRVLLMGITQTKTDNSVLAATPRGKGGPAPKPLRPSEAPPKSPRGGPGKNPAESPPNSARTADAARLALQPSFITKHARDALPATRNDRAKTLDDVRELRGEAKPLHPGAQLSREA